MKKTIFRCGLAFCLSLFTLLPKQSLAQQLLLDSLIAEVVRVNPNLKAAELRYKTFEARIPQAGSLPDPMLKGAVSNLPINSWSLN